METGSEGSFADFFQVEYLGLVRSLRLITGDLGEAEDLAQEAMARAFERWERVRTLDSAIGYVYRTAVNINRKRLRHLAVRARHQSGSMQGTSSDEGATRAELTRALASLPIGQREAFMAVEWLGLSSDEAGKVLGIRPSSVRSRVHRAREALRGLLRLSTEEVDENG